MSGASPAWIIVTKRGHGNVVPGRAPQREVDQPIIGALRLDATGPANRFGGGFSPAAAHDGTIPIRFWGQMWLRLDLPA
jgi:hypothetical protein